VKAAVEGLYDRLRAYELAGPTPVLRYDVDLRRARLVDAAHLAGDAAGRILIAATGDRALGVFDPASGALYRVPVGLAPGAPVLLADGRVAVPGPAPPPIHRPHNAVAESFFATLEKELLEAGPFDDARTAAAEIGTYIESYYNAERQHSSLDYLSPIQYERLTHLKQSA